MEKTEIMIEYEIKIDSIVNWDCIPIGYAKYLESELVKARAKAEAYDRLMSGGKKTLKEIANIFGSIVAMDESGRLHLFGMEPKINKNVGEWQPAYRSYHERVPICDIDFTGDWKDSLTLPDGWEEA